MFVHQTPPQKNAYVFSHAPVCHPQKPMAGMAPRTSLAANNSTLACDTVEAKAKPLRLGFINIALVNNSERMLNLVEPPIYPQIITYRNPTMSSDLPPNVTPRADTSTYPIPLPLPVTACSLASYLLLKKLLQRAQCTSCNA
jgi:hypothetical protein